MSYISRRKLLKHEKGIEATAHSLARQEPSYGNIGHAGKLQPSHKKDTIREERGFVDLINPHTS